MLLLLSVGDVEVVPYRLTDFQNVALCSREVAKSAVDSLVRLGWVRRVNQDNPGGAAGFARYDVAHDYLKSAFRDVCAGVSDLQVRKNIEHYQAQHSRRSNEGERTYSDRVCKRYRRFFAKDEAESWSGQRRKANVLLAVMLVACGAIDCNILLGGPHPEATQCVELAFVQMMLAGSIYYVYNYFTRFMCVLGGGGLAVLVSGMILCGLCLACSGYWGVWLGMEVVFIGALLASVRSPKQTFDQEFFRHRGRVNIVTGALIVLLGSALYPNVRGDLPLMLSLFTLYGLFIGFCIFSHINDDCLMGHVGKVLYVAQPGKENEG